MPTRKPSVSDKARPLNLSPDNPPQYQGVSWNRSRLSRRFFHLSVMPQCAIADPLSPLPCPLDLWTVYLSGTDDDERVCNFFVAVSSLWDDVGERMHHSPRSRKVRSIIMEDCETLRSHEVKIMAEKCNNSSYMRGIHVRCRAICKLYKPPG